MVDVGPEDSWEADRKNATARKRIPRKPWQPRVRIHSPEGLDACAFDARVSELHPRRYRTRHKKKKEPYPFN